MLDFVENALGNSAKDIAPQVFHWGRTSFKYARKNKRAVRQTGTAHSKEKENAAPLPTALVGGD
jgi:hypothetical protein